MDFSELPIGFGMALMQDYEAGVFFAGCTPAQQQAILRQAQMIQSKEQMQAFVAHLPSAAL